MNLIVYVIHLYICYDLYLFLSLGYMSNGAVLGVTGEDIDAGIP